MAGKKGEEEKDRKAGEQGTAGKARRAAAKPASGEETSPKREEGRKKSPAKKAQQAAESGPDKKVSEAGEEKAAAREEAQGVPESGAEAGAAGPSNEEVSAEAGGAGKEEGAEKELTEEEFRRLLEEQMEKITVRDVVFQMMASLASLAYQKLGLPENVNLKYRDFAQARMAIDGLKGLLTSLEGKLEEGELSPFRGTLANLQMNYVRLVKPSG